MDYFDETENRLSGKIEIKSSLIGQTFYNFFLLFSISQIMSREDMQMGHERIFLNMVYK